MEIVHRSGGSMYRGWISTKVWNATDPRKMISAEMYNGSIFLRVIKIHRKMNLMRKIEIVSNKNTMLNGVESLKYRNHKEADAPYVIIFFHLQSTIFPKLSGILMMDKIGSFCSAIIASFARGVMFPHSGPGLVAMNPAYRGTRWLLAISRDSEDCNLNNESIPTAKRIDRASAANRIFGIENRKERMIRPASRRQAITSDERRIDSPNARKIKPNGKFLLVNKTAPAMIRQILGTSEFMIGDQADKEIPIKRKIRGEYLLFLGKNADKSRKDPRLMNNAAGKDGTPNLRKGAYNTGSIPPLM
ncbi:MAG: hypothetical protein CVU46_03160 [Chloroflexi bacterium HGW-Chloroflexi-8]|nr:MAG: hypothetical protein CVU46_03160 [Chloroflexi bacterium HGW-Chloroflexi-8]